MKNILIFLLIIFLTPGNLLSWKITKEQIKTADGVTLVAKRYFNPGGIPVILQHGFALNYNSWDYPKKSFAKFLANKGYDVWLPNLRGHGEDQFQSGPSNGVEKWDMDTFVAYDVPAILHYVIKKTGQKPFWIGHSMGGTIMYIYLEGVWGKKVTEGTSTGLKMEISKKLARKRNGELRGFVAIASPAGLGFPVSLKGKGLSALLKYNYYSYDLLLQMAANYPWSKLSKLAYILADNESILDRFHLTPPIWVNNFTGTLLLNILTPSIYKYLGESFNGDMNSFVRFIEYKLHIKPINFILNMLWNTKNTSKAGIFYIISKGLDNFSIRLLEQWHNWLRNKAFQEQCDIPNCTPLNYYPGLKNITLPILLIAGNADKLVNKINVYRVYKYASSKDKTYHIFPGYGHIDLLMGEHVEEVFNFVYRWLLRH